ncbi:MAG: alpha/beta hydrolase [Cellulosilyticaceae bacterium]
MKKSKKIITYTLVGVVILVLLGLGGMIMWANDTYAPTEQFYELVPHAAYTKEGDFYVFDAQGKDKKTGVILYPGALVEPLAYGYYADELAKEGYLVAIPEVFLNLSLTQSDKAEELMIRHPEIEAWYVGGHSMGGVSAAMFAKDNQAQIDGLILLGSYPATSTDLSTSQLKVLSLYAENDGLTTLEDIINSKVNLPETTVFTEIIGGNHAQFGMYGIQPGDNKAQIDVVTQQMQMVEQTLAFLQQQ